MFASACVKKINDGHKKMHALHLWNAQALGIGSESQVQATRTK